MIFYSIFLVLYQVNSLYTPIQTLSRSNGFDFKLITSRNGSRMVTGNTNRSLIIYKFINGKYEYEQQLIDSSNINGVYISGNQDYVLSARSNSFQLYQYNSQLNSYELAMNKPINFALRAKITEDSKFIVVSGAFPQIYIYQYSGSSYVLIQTLTIGTSFGNDIFLTDDSSYLICGDTDGKVWIYRNDGNLFSLESTILTGLFQIIQVYISGDLSELIVFGDGSFGEVYQFTSNNQYALKQTINLPFSLSLALSIANDMLAIGGLSSQLLLFKKNQLSIFVAYQTLTFVETQMRAVWFDQTGSILSVSTNGDTYIYSQCKIMHCLNCFLGIECTICENGYELKQNGLCDTPENISVNSNSTNSSNISSNISGNISNISGNMSINETSNQLLEPEKWPQNNCLTFSEQQSRCLQYCHQSCANCSHSAQNCISCAPVYDKSKDGTCQLPLNLKILSIFYSIGSMFRVRKSKNVFFFLDDIWLYQYHKPEYKGTIAEVFETARILENIKNEVISLENSALIQNLEEELKVYDKYSNQKYMRVQQKNDSLPQNTIGYFLETVPFTICIFLLNKLIFSLTFNYSISQYFRAASLNGFLVVSLIEGNIKELVFYSMRNLQYLVAHNFAHKLYSLFLIMLLFVVVLFTFAGYFLLRYFYKKLFKYFLDNTYRIKGSCQLMVLLYCVRPFLEGCVHALLFKHNQVQLVLLGVIDLFTFLIVMYQQNQHRNYKSEISFCFLAIYLFSGVILNSLLLGSVKFGENEAIFEIVNMGLYIVIIVRGVAIIFGLIFNWAQLYLKRTIEKEEENTVENDPNTKAGGQKGEYIEDDADMKVGENQIKKGIGKMKIKFVKFRKEPLQRNKGQELK